MSGIKLLADGFLIRIMARSIYRPQSPVLKNDHKLEPYWEVPRATVDLDTL